MRALYSAAALVALLLAGCAEGPTAPPLTVDDSPLLSNAPAGLANLASADADEDLLMSLMGGGIEGVPGGAELGSLDAVSTRMAQAAGFKTIDVPGALATRAFGISAGGEIVGSYTDGTGTHGYLWANGTVTIIKFPGAISTEAWGINPQGDIVGRYRIAGDTRTFGFLLSDGVFTDISVTGHLVTLPIKISPSREIVGCFHDTNFLVDMRGYAQLGDKVTWFALLPSTMHNGVTTGGGLIAGIFFQSETLVHGYVLNRGVYTQFDAPGATFTQAWDVSPTGTVVGYFNPATSHGFSLDANRFTVIDVPGARWTRIFGINPQGDMVGSYADASNAVHGFLLKRGGKNKD
jgi:probable HAF family extracellular repeat protein